MKCPNCGAENPEDKVYCGDCGSTLRQPAPTPYPYVLTPRKPPLKLSVNILCLVGAIIAVMSFFLPWTLAVHQTSGEETLSGAFEFGSNFRYAVTLFLIGTIVAFLTPLGGLLQLIGSSAFILTAMTTMLDDYEMIFWTGAGAAFVASIFVLTSLAMPIGFGYGPDKGFTVVRVLTWTVYR